MFKQMCVVFLKELKCIFRDKKTFIVGLIVPLLLLPCILLITDFSMKNSQDQIVNNVKIGVNNKENSFFSFIKAQSGITIVDVEDADAALSSGKIYAYITVGESIDEKIFNKQDFDIDIKDGEDTSVNSMMVSSILGIYIYSFKNDIIPEIIEGKLAQDSQGLNKLLSDFDITNYVQNIVREQTNSLDLSSIYFNMLVPMMLIMYCCIGSSSTASDLSAGEKERGTLESLLSTGADRTAIIVGKLFATTVVGGLSGICTTLGLWGYLIISSNNSVKLSFLEILILLIVTLSTAMFFAAVNLTIGVYSRSYKEAQTYLTPVLLICLAPTFFTYTMDIGNISLMHLCVPILNVICIIKEIFGGAVNFIHLGIVLSWLLIYVGAAFFTMQSLFKKEEVLFRL